MYCVWLAEDIAVVWPVVVVAAAVNNCGEQTEGTAVDMNNVPDEDTVAVSIVVAVAVWVSAVAAAVAVDIVVDYQYHTVPTSLTECTLGHTESTVLNSFQECD